jgi:primary-amine oxidase
MLLAAEVGGATELALSSPRMVEGLAKRGIKPEQVFCVPLTAGAFGGPDERGRRLMKVPCFLKPNGSNYYAKPVEGLLATVDLRARQVIAVLDSGVVPVPRDDWGYTPGELQQRARTTLPGATTALTRRAAAGYRIRGSQIEWDLWRFHVRAARRPGVVLSQVEVRDGDAFRSVLYQAHLSEVFVPYMDPDRGWSWRTYMDSGEYGFGLFLSPLRRDVDCPAYATFLPAMTHTDDGTPLELPDALCVFERETGDPAYRHYEFMAQEARAVPAEGRPATELVVRSASEIGNYDYFIDYVFQQNGALRVMVGATGLDAVKGVRATSMRSPSAAEDTRHGTLIAPQLVAPNHDHFFNFRLDLDVDGTDNTFMRMALEPARVPKGSPRRSLWETHHSSPRTELEGRYRVNPATPAEYHVSHRVKRGSLGHAPGYMIALHDSAAYSPLDVVGDPPMRRNAYIEYTLWTTPYRPSERYAGGAYALQSDGSDGLAAWVKQNRRIDGGDLVTWLTVGFHHVPHVEDWPIMSTHWKSFTLMPFNFFGLNPAMLPRAAPAP